MSSLGFAGVSVVYDRRIALHPFTDSVKPGEWLCLIGPNGAGKSSALRAVAGLAPHTGSVTVDGMPLADRSPRCRAAVVAYVPQSPLMPADMTGAEYVLLGRNPYIGYFGSETRHDRALVADVLRRLDLEDFADRRLGTLSGGEQQRLVIARAVAQEAPILLLDEPTSALDPERVGEVLDVLRSLAQEGLTMLIVTHEMRFAREASHRVLVLHGGRILEDGTPAEVLDAPKNERTRAFLGLARG